MTFSFLRDDLVEASLYRELGDIIMYQEGYFEVEQAYDNQLFVGKDPDYPYATNPLNPGLENFGYSVSVNCVAVPAQAVVAVKLASGSLLIVTEMVIVLLQPLALVTWVGVHDSVS